MKNLGYHYLLIIGLAFIVSTEEDLGSLKISYPLEFTVNGKR